MSSPIKITAGGVRWLILPEHRHQLLGPHGLRLDEWLDNGQALVIKQGPHRTVYRLGLPDLPCYLKHNSVHNTRAWLRQLVRPSKARMEYQRALAVAARKVPTVLPLALGERGAGLKPEDSFLVTRSLEGTMPLTLFLGTVLPGFAPLRHHRVRYGLAIALGKFIAQLHDAGVTHNDLHCGNVLIRLDEVDHPLLYLIDLQAVRLGRPLDWRASRANLVMLNRWLSVRSNRADRLRFWKAYCAARFGKDLNKDRGRDLEAQTEISNERFWRHRDRRCLARNRYYLRIRTADVRGHAVKELDSTALAALLANPDEPFSRPGAILLKNSRSSTVAELELPVNGRLCPVIYKRFRLTTWTDPFVALLRRSPPLRSWIHGHGMRERGLPTPRPLAVFHRRRHGLLQEGYLLTEKIPEAVDLHGFLAGLDSPDSVERQTVLRPRIGQLARLIREMHRRHLSHRDLKAANVLLRTACLLPSQAAEEDTAPDPLRLQPPAPDPQEPFWLIDLVGVRRHRKVGHQQRVANLARLHASFHQDSRLTRTDKLRFLRVYLQWGFLGREGWKRWWREIALATQAKVARNARNRRPLA